MYLTKSSGGVIISLSKGQTHILFQYGGRNVECYLPKNGTGDAAGGECVCAVAHKPIKHTALPAKIKIYSRGRAADWRL